MSNGAVVVYIVFTVIAALIIMKVSDERYTDPCMITFMALLWPLMLLCLIGVGCYMLISDQIDKVQYRKNKKSNDRRNE